MKVSFCKNNSKKIRACALTRQRKLNNAFMEGADKEQTARQVQSNHGSTPPSGFVLYQKDINFLIA